MAIYNIAVYLLSVTLLCNAYILCIYIYIYVYICFCGKEKEGGRRWGETCHPDILPPTGGNLSTPHTPNLPGGVVEGWWACMTCGVVVSTVVTFD